MEQIKVLMIGSDASVKGGITSVITQLLNFNWFAENIEMHFIPTYVDKTKIRKIIFFVSAYWKIKRELKINRPDIVHMHMSYNASFSRKFMIHKLCMKYNIPDIIHLHGSEFKKWYEGQSKARKIRIRTLLRECKALIVLGNKWKKIVKAMEPSANTIVVSNTVSIPQEKAFWNEPLQFLFLGVLIKRKGVSDLLDAIKMFKDSGREINAKFVIAGSGNEEENLKKKAAYLQIEDLVTFNGWADGVKKNELLKKSQVLLLPSYNEGLPIAILEGLSYGLPIISTNVGDIPSAVIDGKNGFLIKPGDYKELAEKIIQISLSRDLYEMFSKNAKTIAKEKFSDEMYCKEMVDTYKSIRQG